MWLSINVSLSEVRIEGLETLDYLDNLYRRERFTEQGDALTFESEVSLVRLLMLASKPYHVKVWQSNNVDYFITNQSNKE